MKLLPIPEGRSNDWSVEHIVVSEDDAKRDAMRALISSQLGRYTPAGTYATLKRRGAIVMSATPDEVRDLRPVRLNAQGHVLITGLGLGCAVCAAFGRAETERVTVIEISPDVIRLVGPTLQTAFDGRLTIIEADALTWRPPNGDRYGYVWHDIWDNICADNLPEMMKLKRRFGRRTRAQECWCEHLCRRGR